MTTAQPMSSRTIPSNAQRRLKLCAFRLKERFRNCFNGSHSQRVAMHGQALCNPDVSLRCGKFRCPGPCRLVKPMPPALQTAAASICAQPHDRETATAAKTSRQISSHVSGSIVGRPPDWAAVAPVSSRQPVRRRSPIARRSTW